MTEEEIAQLKQGYANLKEEVVQKGRRIEELERQLIGALLRMEELERQLAKDSHNSSKPPCYEREETDLGNHKNVLAGMSGKLGRKIQRVVLSASSTGR